MVASLAPARADRLPALCRQLMAGYQTDNWWPARTRFEVMVGAVLVQNTRWANVRPAIVNLRGAGLLGPDALAKASPQRLTGLIRSAGCQRVKAGRLRHLAQGVVRAGGMRLLARLSTRQLRGTLLRWHGIGEESADAILLYAFQRPVFIGDAYARRWLARTGLFDAGGGSGAYRRCHEFITDRLDWPADAHQSLHAAIVLHGQRVCGPRPACSVCHIRNKCIYKQ